MKFLKKIAKSILCKPEYSVYINVHNVNEEKIFDGCRALITGGSRGIGRQIALRISQQGGTVVVTGRDENLLQSLSKNSDRIYYIVFDVKDILGYPQLIEDAQQLLGGSINTLVLNAGISNHEASITDVSIQSYDDQFDTNLKANFFMLKEYGKLIETTEQEDRSVLVVSSETADMPYEIPYGLTKASLNRLVEGFSHRYYKRGCRINAIAPGETYTDMEKKSGIIVDEHYGYARKNCAGRLFLPEEIAEVACFILSRRAQCISGEIIHCDANDHMKSYLD